MDYRTAAAVMGINVDGVKKHLRSAKKRARQLDELNAFRTSTSTEGGAP
jgi:DNA-directed RNA polymerase specialized sigma24 family protein